MAVPPGPEPEPAGQVDRQAPARSLFAHNGGGGLGSCIGRGTLVSYSHQNAEIHYIRVMGENGDVNYVFGPSDPTSVLSFTDPDGNDESAVTFIFDYPEWADKLYIQAANHPFALPSADYDRAQNVLNPDGSNSHACRAIVSSPTMSFHRPRCRGQLPTGLGRRKIVQGRTTIGFR